MFGFPFYRVGISAAAITAVVLFGSADGPNTSNTATVAESRPIDSWKKRHEAFVQRAKKGNVDVLFVGDSITQRWENEGKSVWDESFASRNAANFGISGDRTQHLLWRVSAGQELAGLEPKVIVLLIGTNNLGHNSPAEIAAGIRAIVAECRKQKPRSQILLLGLLPRAGRPVPEGVAAAPAASLNPKIAAVNTLLFGLEDEAAVEFLDIGDNFLDAKRGLSTALMPDYLHLSEDGYRIFAETIRQPIGDLTRGKASYRRRAKGTEHRVDGIRVRLMMWMSGANR